MDEKRSICNIRNNIGLYIISVVVSLYLSVVVYMTICDDLKYIMIIPILCLVIYTILVRVGKSLASIKIHTRKIREHKNYQGLFVRLFLFILAGGMLYWLAYYPGGFNLDAYGQWDQVHGIQKLNNWHPVLTTGLLIVKQN